MSPGSRNAPLTISFSRNDKIRKWIIPDERAAGFIALGIAQENASPVVLCCTSGTAMLNYAPAIAEAFYRQIPLIVLSADRPPELIDQRDGQTIRQFDALKNHVKHSFQLPAITSDVDAAVYEKDLIEAISAAQILPKGPVHINIPFREPFYPDDQMSQHFNGISLPKMSQATFQNVVLPEKKKVLVLAGQGDVDAETKRLIADVATKVPVIRSPLNNLQVGIAHVDSFIADQSHLVPDLLITSGLSVLSKNLKRFIRDNKPSAHLHFDPAGVEVDTYRSSPKLIKAPLKDGLEQLLHLKVDETFLSSWEDYRKASQSAQEDFVADAAFSETTATYQVLSKLPDLSVLHLSNSMPVRYADLFGVKDHIYSTCNRGTSGIDGCTSTALGNALVSEKEHFLITGDLAFLYDRNAFFHNYQVPNLRIIVTNNGGGGIFRLIEGPSNLPELESYFETRHNRTSEYLCKENQIEYFTSRSKQDIDDCWIDFLKPSKHIKLLEVFTDPSINQKVYKELKTTIHERIHSMEESRRL